MPNRIIKESICTSDTLDGLSWFEEVVFYRLMVNCDDYGRFDGRASIIKSRLFPLKGNITEKSVVESINKLSTVGLVVLYEFEGKPYLQLATWDRHQQVRAKKSKYPAFDITCNQMKSDDCNSPRNPIQSESLSESLSESKHAQECAADLFLEFWKAYPKKSAKPTAQKAFEKVKPDRALLDTMLMALDTQKKLPQWVKDNGQFIPLPATWINQRRWEDETEAKPYNGGQTNNPFLRILQEGQDE